MLRRADDADDDNHDDDDDEKEKYGYDKLLECLANQPLTCFHGCTVGRLPNHNFDQIFFSEMRLRTLDLLSDASFVRVLILEHSQGKS